MANKDRKRIEIDKEQEPRKKGISNMIDEGGLGADKYYDIKKSNSAEEEEEEEEEQTTKSKDKK